MSQKCAACGKYRDRYEYSLRQWCKEERLARCKYCVEAGNWYVECPNCDKTFTNQNNLKMHMQTHRPRVYSCPICGEQRFKSGANAVQHVESGYCSCCRGKEHARDQIYRFARSKASMRPFMNQVPRITYGGDYDDTPDYPYKCPTCQLAFHQLSQLLQHQDAKHNMIRALAC